ncbi:MAG: LytTR family transcriptional regulator [Chitinophagaceae bacterium]|jgi:two-component system LytT family response regulator|nr:LytTR family transcriptional regulator [Chitinophagaceae bacterium]
MNTATPIVIPHPLVTKAPVLAKASRVAWQKLAVPTVEEVRFVPFSDILYCTAQLSYTRVFTRSGKTFVCCKTLKDIESSLPDDMFLRIHHSYLVNVNDITALKKKEGMLEINQEVLLPVSRNLKKSIIAFLCG